jgi:hypothetical protein
MNNNDLLDILVAHGVPGEAIVRVAKLIADAEQAQDRRARNTERMRTVRTHAHTQVHTETQGTALIEEEKKEVIQEESKKKKVRKSHSLKTALPDDWQPKGPQRDPTEAEEFRVNARANGRVYANWDAAYQNYQQHPVFNHRNKPGWQPPSAAVIPINETPAQTHARIEALRLEIVKQVEEKRVKAAQATRVWQDTGLGPHGPGDPPELRPARGVLSGEAPGGHSTPVSAAPWKNGGGRGHG